MSGRALDVLTASTTIATFVPDDGSDVVLFDTSTKQLHRLPASAASVWAAIDGRRSISQVRSLD